MIAVVITPQRYEALDDALLPDTGCRAEAHGLVYRLYFVEVKSSRPLQEYRDLDGRPLVTTRYFDTESQAKAWVASDIARRGMQ